MTEYLVFEERELEGIRAYVLLGQKDSSSGPRALKEATTARAVELETDVNGDFWSTPARSWRGLRIGTKVVVSSEELHLPGMEPEAEAAPPEELPPANVAGGSFDEEPAEPDPSEPGVEGNDDDRLDVEHNF